jgi:hypothetical protein
VVHGGGHEQRRDRRALLVAVPVGQHDDPGARGDGLGDLRPELLDRLGERGAATVDVEVPGDPDGGVTGEVAVVVDVQDLGQLVVVDDRERQEELPAGRRHGLQQVLLRPEGAPETGHQLLADGVQRRVRDLGEQLPEVVVEQARAVRERRDGRVGAHRTDRLGTAGGHRRHQDAQLLLGVPEHHLPPDDGLVAGP